MNILIVDGQGGNIGTQLVKLILARLPGADITAVGTNSAATAAMRKAGAVNCATGENAVIVNSRRADIIVGPIGIVIADALLGEVTPAMAAAVGSSNAKRVLIPINRCDTMVAGVSSAPLSALLDNAVDIICSLM